MNKPQRGGLRNPPGGRPTKESRGEETRRKVSITLDAATVEWIKAQRVRENEPLSRIIERLLQRGA